MTSMKSMIKKALCLLCVLSGCTFCFSLDREAFSITNYDLHLQIEPEQHRLGARGKITLRNDTSNPQKLAVLQISSSLDWRAIRAGDKMLQFVTQPYTSDIDHTGSLSEAIVTLPQEVAPHSTIDLAIAYEGVILLDATRLTRIGTPEDFAKNSDWDRIDEDFTAVRGAGYVAWYPIATESANLSEGDSLFEVLARWKSRQTRSMLHLEMALSSNPAIGLRAADDENGKMPQVFFNGTDCAFLGDDNPSPLVFDCRAQSLRWDAPTLVIAKYQVLEKPGIELHYLKGHEAATTALADAAQQIAPLIADWFGPPRERAKIAELPYADAAPFESGLLLLTPLKGRDSNYAGLTVAHQLTHASLLSFRPWIEEGLAHFAQAVYLEQQKGRQAALDYIAVHRTALTRVEPIPPAADSQPEEKRSLVNTIDEQLYRSKAMCVWWMLRDMIGDAALKKAIASYQPEQDQDPTYMPQRIAAQTRRDLSWFFDDWLYHDRGLPEFKVDSAYAGATPTKSFMLTVSLENSGTAGAEVPVTIKFAGGEVTKRIEMRAKSKATFRIETPAAPQEIRVNDGSVPESDLSNNTYKVEPPEK
jgi:hypothetical protein